MLDSVQLGASAPQVTVELSVRKVSANECHFKTLLIPKRYESEIII